MLGNCDDKMLLISSTPNQWPQNHIDEKQSLMASTTSSRVMENQTQQQQVQQQQVQLKCPRCDSSNTKFCYYNNYSLSQPRHFCKACKRYWTRGGTLRNVPVGGGCRKNKRVKRPATSAAPSSISSSTSNPNINSVQVNAQGQPQMDLSSSTLFYGLPTNPFNSRVSNVENVCGYDLQPHVNGLGLGFDGSTASNPLLSSYPIFGSSTSASPTMASLIASSFQQQKLVRGGNGNFLGLVPYEDMQMQGMKEVKMEGNGNRFDWNVPNSQNQIHQMGSSDPSLLWNSTGVGAWLDPANLGSSVPSLI
ncbi:hypothetical protein RJ640_030073 [Escallonia rubra]|uniref:Dof zinc finger protein n=1 Tax=Escallonia rubra TaxID=112253 RepID=A0AA88UAY7_9ASTE|nr:hypothetical protein RJ640_030073 [Escallonia rubra]